MGKDVTMTNILDLIIDRIAERFASTQARARRPSFKDTEHTPWANVAKTFAAYRDGFYKHTDAERPDDLPSRVQDAPAVMRNWIASKTLLGNASAEKESDLISFPVVNPATNKLNAGGLRGAISRASQASVSAETVRSIQSVGRDLLEKEFTERSSSHPDEDDEDNEDYQTKFTKQEVQYRPEENDGKRCGNCFFFQAPNACEIVEGDIDEAFVCDRWQAQYTGDFLVPISKDMSSQLMFPVSTFFRDGQKRQFTPAQAAEMVDNFKNNIPGRKNGWLPINKEHVREGGRIAYIVDMFLKDGIPHAKIEDAPGFEGAMLGFDYLSPEIRWEWTHPFNGKTYKNVLFGAGATNYPFFLDQMAIHADTIAWMGSGWEQVIESKVQVVSFSTADEHERIATGIVLQPDVPDGQGHSISAEEIRLTFERFMGGELTMDLHHKRDVGDDEAVIVANWLQDQDELWRLDVDGEIRETLVPAGSWCASVKCGTGIWSEVLEGEVTGFSARGMGMLKKNI